MNQWKFIYGTLHMNGSLYMAHHRWMNESLWCITDDEWKFIYDTLRKNGRLYMVHYRWMEVYIRCITNMVHYGRMKVYNDMVHDRWIKVYMWCITDGWMTECLKNGALQMTEWIKVHAWRIKASAQNLVCSQYHRWAEWLDVLSWYGGGVAWNPSINLS